MQGLCFASLEQALQAFPPVPFPFVEEEVPLFVAADTYLDRSCQRHSTKVLDHMSTANVARDMDLMRQAVGDDQLNYVGLSYGSYLGQTYANLFPDSVGAFVIDGILDPLAWANVSADVPFSTALHSDIGAQETLDEFIAQCEAAEPSNCAFAPNTADRLEELLERLRQKPILITDPATGETVPYLYSFLVGDMLGGLYSPSVYAEVAEFVGQRLIHPSRLPSSVSISRPSGARDRHRSTRSPVGHLLT